MSNDDRPEGYTEFMMALDRRRSFLIAALCPNFSKIRANGGNTAEILRSLGRKGYELFFWVMEHQYGGSETVTNKQISQLQKFGTVEVFTRQAEAPARARALRKFVADALLT